MGLGLGLGLWWPTKSSLIAGLIASLRARSTYFENKNCTKATLQDLDDVNLLEKASIVTTPTAYNDGSLNSVKPEQTFGDEEVTNGDFATDSDWSKSASVVISDGKITTTVTSGGYQYFSQLINYESGKQYKLIIKVNGDSGFNCAFYDAAGNNGGLKNADGLIKFNGQDQVIELDFIANNNSNTILCARSGSGNFSYSIDSVSVKEVIDADFDFQRGSAATRVNSQGLIENVQTLSGNLVQNGDFSQESAELITNGDFSNGTTDWNFTSGASLTDLGAKITHTPTAGSIAQSLVLVVGKQYKLTYEITESIAGGLKFNSAVDASMVTTVGVHTKYLQADATTAIFGRTSSSNNDITINNISIVEVGQDWEFTDGATITDNGVRIVSDGTLQKITQNNILTVGKQYKIQYEILENNSGELKMSSSFGLTPIPSIVGTHTVYAEALQTFLSILRVSTCDITIDNISVIEITEDTDLPRIDYTDGCGSLLLEPQSTNGIIYSEDFSSYSGSTVNVVSNYAISPDGKTNATKFIPTVNNTQHQKSSNTSISLSSGDKVTYSIFAKADEYANIVLTTGVYQIYNSWVYVAVNLNNGEIKGSNADSTFVQDYGNGWYRIGFTATVTQNYSYDNLTIKCSNDPDNTAQGPSFSGDGTSGILIYGTQHEVDKSYPTSYIPTNGSTVTRNADVCNNAGSSDLINSTEGVLYGEFSTNNTDSPNWLNISDTTAVNWLFLGKQDGDIRVYLRANNSVILDYTKPLEDKNKIALSYKSGDIKVYINGINVDNSTSTFSFTSALSRIDFNQYNGGGTQTQIAWKALAVFKEALTNDELEGLTGEGYDTFNALALANNYTII